MDFCHTPTHVNKKNAASKAKGLVEDGDFTLPLTTQWSPKGGVVTQGNHPPGPDVARIAHSTQKIPGDSCNLS